MLFYIYFAFCVPDYFYIHSAGSRKNCLEWANRIEELPEGVQRYIEGEVCT